MDLLNSAFSESQVGNFQPRVASTYVVLPRSKNDMVRSGL
jgi:hypothetical protein